MAELDKLVVRIEADLKDLKKGLEQARGTVNRSSRSMSSSFKNLGNALANVGKRAVQFGGIFGGIFTAIQIKKVLDVSSSLENLELRLEAIFQSSEKAKQGLEIFTEFASRTPFQLEEIQAGGVILSTVINDLDKLNKFLRITGNVASITGLDFQTTAEQIQRSLAGGIASADLFREKGVRQLLGFQQGATVSISETAKAFENVFGEGGRFGQATDKLAFTFAGTISMLQDKLFTFRKAVGESFFAEVKKSLAGVNQSLDNSKEKIIEFGREVGRTLAEVTISIRENFAEIVQAISTIGTLLSVTVGAFLIRALFSVAGAISVVVASIITFRREIENIHNSAKEFYGGLLDNIKGFVGLGDSAEKSEKALKDFKKTQDDILRNIRDSIFQQKLLNAVSGVYPQILKKTEEETGKVGKISEEVKETLEKLGIIIDEAGVKISDAFASALVSGENFGEALKGIFRDALQQLISFITHLFIIKPLIDAIQKSLTDIREQQDDAIRKQLVMMALGMPSGGGGTGFGFRQAGGLVQAGRPTYVGESGRELIVPAVNSRVIPNSDLGGGITINQSLNFATGVVPTVRAEVMNMLPVIKQETMSAVADQRVRGGSFARTLVRGG
jgi:uncharacterized protein YoaH (UPF0181 family)